MREPAHTFTGELHRVTREEGTRSRYEKNAVTAFNFNNMVSMWLHYRSDFQDFYIGSVILSVGARGNLICFVCLICVVYIVKQKQTNSRSVWPGVVEWCWNLFEWIHCDRKLITFDQIIYQGSTPNILWLQLLKYKNKLFLLLKKYLLLTFLFVFFKLSF